MTNVHYTKTCCYGTIDPYIDLFFSFYQLTIKVLKCQATHLVMGHSNSLIMGHVGVFYSFIGISYELSLK